MGNESSVRQASGLPEKMVLKGREVTISPLEVADLAKMEAWVTEAPLRKIMTIINSDTGNMVVTAENRDRLVYEAIKEGSKITMNSKKGQAMLESLSGVRYVLWLSMSKTDTSLTIDKVFDLVDLGNLSTVTEALDRVSGMKENATGE